MSSEMPTWTIPRSTGNHQPLCSEANGYSVGIISQPDWKDENSISIFGEPRLGFLVSSGNMDSMVNHYTVAKKHRKKMPILRAARWDFGRTARLPSYGNLIRRTYKHTPMILGGIEACSGALFALRLLV